MRERAILAAFMALQLTRTPEQRERVLFPRNLAAYAGEREIDAVLVEEYLERVHLGFRPKRTEVEAALAFVQMALQGGALTRGDAIELMLESVDHLVPALLNRCWTLEIARKPRFLTSDLPVVIWRNPSPRDQYEGIGVANAEEIRFPIDPGKQLVLTQNDRPAVRSIEPDRVRGCNADMAQASHRLIVGHPHRMRLLQQVSLSPKRPILRFNMGPLYEKGPGGAYVREGEVLHAWVPRR
jgi:hypothetical protein